LSNDAAGRLRSGHWLGVWPARSCRRGARVRRERLACGGHDFVDQGPGMMSRAQLIGADQTTAEESELLAGQREFPKGGSESRGAPQESPVLVDELAARVPAARQGIPEELPGPGLSSRVSRLKNSLPPRHARGRAGNSGTPTPHISRPPATEWTSKPDKSLPRRQRLPIDRAAPARDHGSDNGTLRQDTRLLPWPAGGHNLRWGASCHSRD
jgi:hypothetical protein